MKIAGTAPTPRASKEWSWSYSKLKNYEECPKKHYEVDLSKRYVEPVTPGSALDWGNRVHDAFALTLKTGTPLLPTEMKMYQHWVDRVRRGSGQLLVEQQYAITRDFQKTGYFAADVWYRAKGDVVRIAGDLALVLDWKTGKPLEDPVQLMLMAQCVFSHYPEVNYVRSEYVWLKDGSTSPELFTRKEVADQWVDLMPRVNKLEQSAIQQDYPPKPGRLCKKWCPVTSCPHHGKGW